MDGSPRPPDQHHGAIPHVAHERTGRSRSNINARPLIPGWLASCLLPISANQTKPQQRRTHAHDGVRVAAVGGGRGRAGVVGARRAGAARVAAARGGAAAPGAGRARAAVHLLRRQPRRHQAAPRRRRRRQARRRRPRLHPHRAAAVPGMDPPLRSVVFFSFPEQRYCII
jgi:hypothetical protein